MNLNTMDPILLFYWKFNGPNGQNICHDLQFFHNMSCEFCFDQPTQTFEFLRDRILTIFI